MPKVMLTKGQLEAYKSAAKKGTFKSFSAWVRATLDEKAKQND